LCDFGLGQIERAYRIGERQSAGRKAIGVAIATVFLGVIGFSFVTSYRSSGSERAIRVGSKDFTESVILAEILAQMLEKQGIPVERHLELGGNIPHESLMSGQLDVYPEYTGTAYTAILKHLPLTDPQAVYDQTKNEYAEKLGLVISPPLGFANDFAILVRGD